MKKLFRTLTLILFIVLVVAFSASCNKDNPGSNHNEPSPTAEEPDDPSVTGYDVPNATGISKISYYTVSSNGKVRGASSLISESTKITPELVLSYFIDSLEDESIILEIDSVEVDDSICYISFNETINDIASQGKEFETAILDAAAQSVLDNFDNIDGIGYRINGNAYSTANYTFKTDSVYMGQ